MRNNVARFKNFLKQETPKKYAAVFAGILALCLLLELFVFNFKWLTSVFDKKIDLAPDIISGAERNGDDIKIRANEAVLSYGDLNQKVKYLYFKPGDEAGKTVEITLSANDEGNKATTLETSARTVLSDVERSQYIRLHFSGNVSKLNIKIKGLNNSTISVNDIGLNVHVPLMFSWQRFLILAFALMLLYLLRPNSFVYKIKTDLKDKRQLAVTAALVIVQAGCFFHMIHYNTAALSWHLNYDHSKQYNRLAESFLSGRLDIGDAPEELADLEDPYDMKERQAENIEYRWDNAYYNGKYYVYFGAAPVVLLYLPYKLLSGGGNLPNYIAVYIFGVMVILGILLLLWEIIKKWYKNTPFVLYLLLSVVFGAAAVLGYAVYKPDLYLIPNISAIMFGLFGLAFWLSAESKDKSGETKLSCPRLAAGSFCVAMIAGCRPQMLLIIAIGIMLFWRAAFKERKLFSKSGMKPTLAVCLPFFAVAAVVMSYNYARFGSPFDFGANYNLTGNDMTVRGFVIGRIGLGLFEYLFRPLNVNAVFPFIHDFGVETSYVGLTISERLIGGVYMLFPILLIGLWGAFKKDLFDDRRAYRMVYFLMIMTFIIPIVDAEMAGLLTRYHVDFFWMGLLAATLTIFAVYDRGDINKKKRFISVVLAVSVLTLAAAYLRIFGYSGASVESSNPVLFNNVKYLIAFWV